MKRQNVAVIAVHGVGEHKPFDTVHAIGDLLQDLDQDRPPLTDTPAPPAARHAASASYDPFIERTIRINVRPVVVSDGGGPDTSGIRGPFHDLVARKSKSNRAGESPALEDDDLSFEFMRGQLRNYRGDDPADTYQTGRLEGRRRGHDGDERVVHIYEAFWSDLSNLKGGGGLRIFGELYQLLFHLPSLGTHAVDAEAPYESGWKWAWFRRVQSWSAIALTVPIPLLNLFMLGVAVIVPGLVYLDRLSPGRQLVVSVAANGAALVFGAGLLFWFVFRRMWPLWLLPVILWVAAVAVAATRATGLTPEACDAASP